MVNRRWNRRAARAAVLGLLVWVSWLFWPPAAVAAQSGRQRERPGEKPRTGFELVSEDGGFRVRLPRGFEQPQREDSPTGAVLAFTSTSANETVCQVAVRTLTRPEAAAVAPDQLMDAARDALLRAYKGAIEQEDRYIVQGCPARAVFFGGTRGDKAVFGRVDFVFAPPRLYQLVVVTTFPIELDRDDVQRFFESFTLLNPPAAPSSNGAHTRSTPGCAAPLQRM